MKSWDQWMMDIFYGQEAKNIFNGDPVAVDTARTITSNTVRVSTIADTPIVYRGDSPVPPNMIMMVGMGRIRSRVKANWLSGITHGEYAVVTVTVSADPYIMTFHEKLDVFPSEKLITELMMVAS